MARHLHSQHGRSGSRCKRRHLHLPRWCRPARWRDRLCLWSDHRYRHCHGLERHHAGGMTTYTSTDWNATALPARLARWLFPGLSANFNMAATVPEASTYAMMLRVWTVVARYAAEIIQQNPTSKERKHEHMEHAHGCARTGRRTVRHCPSRAAKHATLMAISPRPKPITTPCSTSPGWQMPTTPRPAATTPMPHALGAANTWLPASALAMGSTSTTTGVCPLPSRSMA